MMWSRRGRGFRVWLVIRLTPVDVLELICRPGRPRPRWRFPVGVRDLIGALPSTVSVLSGAPTGRRASHPNDRKDESSMTHQERIVYGGVDTHEDVHVGAVIDATGRLLGTKAYPTTPIGLRGMLRWMTGQGRWPWSVWRAPAPMGWACNGSFSRRGSGVEVNRPNRQLRRPAARVHRRRRSAARAVLAGHATVVPKSRDGIVESIRVLRIALESSADPASGSAPRYGTSAHRPGTPAPRAPPCPCQSKPLERLGSGPGTHRRRARATRAALRSWPASTSP